MPPRRRLPPELVLSAFTTREAAAADVRRGRLRGTDLRHPHHGVYAVASEDDDIVSRCERLRPVLKPEHWFSHRTAARIWGMPLEHPYSSGEALHVTTIGGRVELRHSSTVGWVMADAGAQRRFAGILPVLGPADVWCQLAQKGAVRAGETVPWEWLVAAADHLLTGKRIGGGRRAPARCTRDDLRAAIERRGRGRGVVRLREALAAARSPVDSPKETLLRLGLVADGLPEPDVQVPVMTAQGLRHADLGYPGSHLLLEYQGDEHRTDRRRWLSDLTRVQLFQDAGYHVMLIGADDLDHDLPALCARVRRALASHPPAGPLGAGETAQ